MRTSLLKAPAKINLGLSILGKLPNGYHLVKTIYSQVSLFDEIVIQEIQQDKIMIYCNDKYIPLNSKNTIYKTVALIKKLKHLNKGIKIKLKKNIPTSSGLGGGSSDAACVLTSLNQLWGLKMSLTDQITIARQIGMDVGYQLVGGVKMETQGDKDAKMIDLGKLPNCLLVLCWPNIKIKSLQAYHQIDYAKIGKNNLQLLCQALKRQNLKEICRNLSNEFENWTFKKYPLIYQIKNKMLKMGALGSLMSGKGSAVFGIFNDKIKAEKAYGDLKTKFTKTFIVKPI